MNGSASASRPNPKGSTAEIVSYEAFQHLLKDTASIGAAYLRGKPHDSAIDIGCRDALALNLLYHDFGFKRLVGLDLDTETSIIQVLQANNDGKLDHARDFFDVYDTRLKTENADVYPAKLNRTEFYKRHSFYFGSIDGRVETITGQFGLVILSNVLHYKSTEEDCKRLLKEVARLLLPDGDTFIRVKEYFDDGTCRRDFPFERYVHLIQDVLGNQLSLNCIPSKNGNANEGRALIATTISL